MTHETCFVFMFMWCGVLYAPRSRTVARVPGSLHGRGRAAREAAPARRHRPGRRLYDSTDSEKRRGAARGARHRPSALPDRIRTPRVRMVSISPSALPPDASPRAPAREHKHANSARSSLIAPPRASLRRRRASLAPCQPPNRGSPRARRCASIHRSRGSARLGCGATRAPPHRPRLPF